MQDVYMPPSILMLHTLCYPHNINIILLSCLYTQWYHNVMCSSFLTMVSRLATPMTGNGGVRVGCLPCYNSLIDDHAVLNYCGTSTSLSAKKIYVCCTSNNYAWWYTHSTLNAICCSPHRVINRGSSFISKNSIEDQLIFFWTTMH